MKNIYKAYAKINIGLNVLGKRSDGFHEIETIFQQINLFDTLRFVALEHGIEVECAHPLVPAGKENICYRAAEILKKKHGIQSGIKIIIEKQIPVGAGLGGGSSDAAGVLVMLNQIWKIGLSLEELAGLGEKLGSDVPFFVYGGTKRATGRGEILTSFLLPIQYKGLLVYPDLMISTSWVYKNFKINLTNTKKNIKLADFNFNDVDINSISTYFKNDLEEVVFPQYPSIQKLKLKLYKIGARFASMSGSGSAVFGLFPASHCFEDGDLVFNIDCKVFQFSPV